MKPAVLARKEVNQTQDYRSDQDISLLSGRSFARIAQVSSSIECGDNTFVRNIAQVNGSGTVNGK